VSRSPLPTDVVLTLFVALVCLAMWSLATMHALQSSPPVMLVYGPEFVQRGEDARVVAVAVRADNHRRVPFEGEVTGPAGGGSLDGEVGTFALPADGCEPCTFQVHGTADDVPVAVPGRVQVFDAQRPPATQNALSWRKWQAELRDRTVKDLALPPLYPLAGRARSALPTNLLVLEEAGPQLYELAPNAASVRAPDGRALLIDRSGVLVTVPVLADAGTRVPVTIRVPEAQRVYVDVFVDGVMRQLHVWSLEAGDNERTLLLPDDARTWFAVRVTGSPLGSADGPQRVGLLSARFGSDPGTLWAELRSSGLVDGLDDPLLARAAGGGLSGEGVALALQGRLQMTAPYRPRLSETAATQLAAVRAARETAVAQWLWPFRASGLLLVLLVSRLAFLSVRAGRRSPPRSAADERAEGEVELPQRPLSSLVWGSVAFIISLGFLWVLDWALTFLLAGVEA